MTSKEYADLIKKHPHLENPREPAKLEQDRRRESVVGKKDKAPRAEPLQIKITDVRKRLIDDDNLCEKFIVDCLRRDGTIIDDSTKFARIFTTQRKCTKEESPHTLIEIY